MQLRDPSPGIPLGHFKLITARASSLVTEAESGQREVKGEGVISACEALSTAVPAAATEACCVHKSHSVKPGAANPLTQGNGR